MAQVRYEGGVLTERRWQPETVPYLVVGMFFSLCLGYLVVAVISSLFADSLQNTQRLLTLAGNLVFVHGALLVMLGVFLRVNRLRWAEAFGWRNGPVGKVFGYSLAATLLVLPLAWTLSKFSALLIERLGGKPQTQLAVQYIQQQPPWWELAGLGVMTILVAPVVEEALFRGILYPTVKQAGYPRAALFGTSLLFAVYHSNLMTLAPLFVLALTLVVVYEATDNLWAPTLVHAIFNLVNFLVLSCQWNLDPYFDWLRIFVP
ncbi:type II CAAX endopeptidase family protein [Fontisphaera persica]|uniref:CPBP family intramembrane glutamic endopeptidase n=1 Tax=Fontisphaera persica TaxID=2974023 RepID=UPI0024BF6EFF|nr:type II CAAX endopeptidase family protein [Fontisphaera persica]WCJ60018.1 type II CAAX endopeptidase family protein [Fontisphaera persica]